MPIAPYKKQALLKKVMENGQRLFKSQKLSQIATYTRERLRLLPEEYKPFNNPYVYKIGLSDNLKNQRDKLIQNYKL